MTDEENEYGVSYVCECGMRWAEEEDAADCCGGDYSEENDIKPIN